MLRPHEVEAIKRLEREGRSISHIARYMGHSRTTIKAILEGKGPSEERREEAADNDYQYFSGTIGRCPECGQRCYLPCMVCRAQANNSDREVVAKAIEDKRRRESIDSPSPRREEPAVIEVSNDEPASWRPPADAIYKGARYRQFYRMFHEASILYSQGEALTLEELNEAMRTRAGVNVCSRTTRRDLDTLTDLRIAVKTQPKGSSPKWRWAGNNSFFAIGKKGNAA